LLPLTDIFAFWLIFIAADDAATPPIAVDTAAYASCQLIALPDSQRRRAAAR
jgi:hypothetical protein